MKKLLLSTILSTFLTLAYNTNSFAEEIKISETYQSYLKTAKVINLGEEEDNEGGRNPLLALGLSFFIPGAGQIYNEEYLKGSLLFISVVSLVILEIFVIEPNMQAFEKDKKTNSLLELSALIGRIGTPSLWIYSWANAYQMNDPEYLKKLKEEEKKKLQKMEGVNAYYFNINILSYNF